MEGQQKEEGAVARESIFPTLKHISQLREAIKGCTLFSESKHDDYISFNYKMGHEDTFPDPYSTSDPVLREQYKLRRECRGIIFNASTGLVLARRYHKFFNVNELDESMPEEISLNSMPYVVLEKLDGTFASPIISNDQLVYATKVTHTNGEAKAIARFVKNNEAAIPYDRFCKEWMDKGYTPIFEWCEPTRKRTVKYTQCSFTLTGIRDNTTGEYVLYEDMLKSAEENGIPCVKAWRGSAASIEELLTNIGKEEGLEGCVLRFDDGRMYKIKSQWYCSQSSNSDFICQERNVWHLILENKMDDVKAYFATHKGDTLEGDSPEHDTTDTTDTTQTQRRTIPLLRKKIDKFSKELYENLEARAKALLKEVKEVSECKDESEKAAKKDALIASKEAYERPLYHKVFASNIFEKEADERYHLEEVLTVLIEYVIANTDRKNKFESVARPLSGNIYFY